MTTPAHRRPGLVALVALGGAVGATARYALGLAVHPAGGWPLGTLLANLLGAFLLGMLLEALVRRGPETEAGRRLRLALGTGLLGGFTTFSSLALELERLLAAGSAGVALGYAAVSLVLGFLACLGGIALAARHHASVGPAGSASAAPDTVATDGEAR